MTEYMKEYREEHREEYNSYMKEYMREYRKTDEFRKKNRDYMKDYMREYRKKNWSSPYCIKGQLELIENYGEAKADDFKDWCIHHRLETHHPDGSKRVAPLRMKSLVELDLYYQRPAEELIFMRKDEHTRLHNSFRRRRRNSDDNQ